MRGTRTIIASIVASMAVAVTACAPVVVTPEPVTVTQVPAGQKAPVPSPPPDPRPETAWQLTGLDATDADPADLERMALAVKIENTSTARPQSNLDRADVVYETMIDYGVSRLIAVFHSDYPTTVGPIRSMRPMDHNIVGHYDGPLIFSGAQRRFIQAADAAGQDLVAQDLRDSGFFRVDWKYAPHNLHGTLTTLAAQAKSSSSAPTPEFQFAYPSEFNSAAVFGKPTTNIRIRFSGSAEPTWKWSDEREAWVRYERSEVHKTYEGNVITADNILVLRVKVQYTSAVRRGISVPETLVAGRSGSGYYAADGMYIPISWSKESRTAPFVITYEGNEIVMKPGQTWVELLPSSGTSYNQELQFS